MQKSLPGNWLSMPKKHMENYSWLTNHEPEPAGTDFSNIPQDNENWSGLIERITLNQKIQVLLSKTQIHKDFELRLHSERDEPFFRFVTILDGEHEKFLEGYGWTTCEVGHSYCFRVSDKYPYADFRYKAGTDINLVSYSFSTDLVQSFLGEDLPESWHKFMAAEQDVGMLDALEYSADAMHHIHQMAQCPHVGRIREIDLEGLALRALAAHAGMFHKLKETSLSAAEMKKIAGAREYLLANMRKPPTLMEMAHEAGMNARRLSRGFKEIYGDGPFAILKNYRLDQARLALLEGGVPLQEISWRVGYRHSNNFSTAYKERFGVNPSQDI